MRLLMVWVAGLVVLAPVALLEGSMGPKVYGWLYGLHPFRSDGVQRYVGFRPLGFFEHGNQYGVWVAATALAAVWMWRSEDEARLRSRFGIVAALALAIAVVSQSAGAILLLLAGLALLWKTGTSMKRLALPLILVLVMLGGGLYLARALPLRALAQNTSIGRQMVDLVRSTGRESFIWRIARDQDALALVGDHPILGAGQWDWWRKDEGRPWDLAVLLLGQFGLIGLVLALGSLLAPALRVLHEEHVSVRRGRPGAPLAVIVLMAVADMLLNSFILYPAILAAGALVHAERPKPAFQDDRRGDSA